MIQWATEKREFLFFKAALSWPLCLGVSSFSSCSLTVGVLCWILPIFCHVLNKVSAGPDAGPRSLSASPRASCRHRRHQCGRSLSSVFPLHYSFCPPQNSVWASSVFQRRDGQLGVNTDFHCPQGPFCCPLLGGTFTSAATAACGLNTGSHLRMLFQDTRFQRANFYICF